MFSAYTWGQFCLFVGVLVVLYYLVVGLLYYRDDVSTLLTPRKKGSPQVAGAAAGAAAPPALVRPTSAFARAATPAPAPGAEPTAAEEPETGAAQNLPDAVPVVVGGELPDSSARATGQDASAPYPPAEAEAATVAAQAYDEARTEELDHANEELAALIRQRTQPPLVQPLVQPLAEPPLALLDAAPAYELAGGAPEPLLVDFAEPIASPLDVIPGAPELLVEADTVAAYLARTLAGQRVAVPAELVGSRLGDQFAHR